MTDVRVAPLDASCTDDFFAVHCEANGLGWCACVAWEVPSWDGWGERTAAQNVALRRQLFDEGRYHGYLLYEDDVAVGWCQCGPRDRWPKLCAAHELAPDPAVWGIPCFAMAPAARGRGLAHALLGGALDDLAGRGVARVEGYPRRGRHAAGEVWTGPEALFARAGFTVERALPGERLLMVRRLDKPTGSGTLETSTPPDGERR